jgi:hypothetical protein
MAPWFSGPSIPTEVDERLRMAAAVAAEQVMDMHVVSALELVDHGAERVPVERLLDTYVRLHSLDVGQEWQVRERVVAALGREMGEAGSAPRLTGSPSLLRRLARRLRGRVHHDLRAWVEVHGARLTLDLIDLHVRHAVTFARILDEHGSASDAVRYYTHALRLPAPTAYLVRLKVIMAMAAPAAPAPAEPHQNPTRHLPLRLADGGS